MAEASAMVFGILFGAVVMYVYFTYYRDRR